MLFNGLNDWYQPNITWRMRLLQPLSWLYALIVMLRAWCYRVGLLSQYRSPYPVIVVGNIAVGGTGKTPFVIWLVNFLKTQGLRPAVVSRGVGGITHAQPHWVSQADTSDCVGDEALLLIKYIDCPFVICTNRAAAICELVEKSDCNILVSDDGLQHYAIARDYEIVMVDAKRQFGNHCLLPAGPLREPLTRLNTVNMVIYNGDEQTSHSMHLTPQPLYSLVNPTGSASLGAFCGKDVHAVAGIGNPDRFFQQLRAEGIRVIPHVFPDHYAYGDRDFKFNDHLPILMTEKDAVKCTGFADERFWCVPVHAVVSECVQQALIDWLRLEGECSYAKA